MSTTRASCRCNPATTPRRRAPLQVAMRGCALACVMGVLLVVAGEAVRAFDPVQYASSDLSVATSLMRASYAAPVELPPVVVAVPVDPQSSKPFDSPFGAALAGQPVTTAAAPGSATTSPTSALSSAQPGRGIVDDGVGVFDGFSIERSREMPDDREMNRRRRLRTIRRFNEEFETAPGVWLRGTAEPNIREPGPDSFNFPNSAYAVPVGVAYLESTPYTYRRYHNSPVITYLTPFLLRVGIFSKVELRLSGSGITTDITPHGTKHGYSPLIFGFKHNWWEEDRDSFIPAAGLEVEVQTDLGSSYLATPQTQPGYSLNFDHSLPLDFVFEWNIGSTYGAKIDGGRVMQFNFEYSLQGPILDNFEMFIHGFVNTPATGTRFKDGSMVGIGGIWYVARRLAVYGSYSHGLTPDSIRLLEQLGLAFAF